MFSMVGVLSNESVACLYSADMILAHSQEITLDRAKQQRLCL
jgi:hypothetical protein